MVFFQLATVADRRYKGDGRRPTLQGLVQNLRQDIRQDAAGAVVVFLYWGIDADDDGDFK